MEIFRLISLLTPQALPLLILIFLIVKFNKTEHQIKDLKIYFDSYIRDNYIRKTECKNFDNSRKCISKIATIRRVK